MRLLQLILTHWMPAKPAHNKTVSLTATLSPPVTPVSPADTAVPTLTPSSSSAGAPVSSCHHDTAEQVVSKLFDLMSSYAVSCDSDPTILASEGLYSKKVSAVPITASYTK